jgi:hypothetical protein
MLMDDQDVSCYPRLGSYIQDTRHILPCPCLDNDNCRMLLHLLIIQATQAILDIVRQIISIAMVIWDS